MSYHWTFLAVLFAATPVLADPPKSNTLTAQEIADGWILLFDGQTTFGWKIEGEANVKDGSLVLGGEKASRAIPTTEFGACEVRLEYLGGMQLAFDGGGSIASLGVSS